MIVNVLLSSYNGEKYIKDQIDSIINQTIDGVGLTVRDDGSKDSTVEIVKSYDAKIPLKVLEGSNLRCVRSFWQLVNDCDDAKYYAFCDQDDVWDVDKLERAVNILDKADNDKPLLYFSDVRVTDINLNVLKEGMAEDFPISYAHSYIRNICPGCTYVFNHKARELMKKISPDAFGPDLHDWVTYRIVAGTGEVFFDKTPSMNYRQHGDNEVGAPKNGLKEKIQKLKSAFKKIFSNKKIKQRSSFAKEMLRLYDKNLTEDAKEITEELAHYDKDKALRKKLLKDKRFYFRGIKYNYFKLMIRMKKL